MSFSNRKCMDAFGCQPLRLGFPLFLYQSSARRHGASSIFGGAPSGTTCWKRRSRLFLPECFGSACSPDVSSFRLSGEVFNDQTLAPCSLPRSIQRRTSTRKGSASIWSFWGTQRLPLRSRTGCSAMRCAVPLSHTWK